MRILFSWVWLVLLFGGTSACSCQSVGLQIPEANNANTNSGTSSNSNNPPSSTQTVEDVTDIPGTFGVHGVAALTFYPKTVSGEEGSFGGYAMFYDKPLDTNVQFAGMKNGECKFATFESNTETTVPYQGINAGESLTFSFASQEWQWTQQPFRYYNQEYGVYYLGQSVEKLRYPYEGDVTFSGTGGADVQAFEWTWKAPARLDLSEPKINFTEPIKVKRSEGLSLAWKFVGKAPYLAVRINQANEGGKGGRTLTCRFAAEGPATMPAAELSKFVPDSNGEKTHIFFFAGRYLLAKVPSLAKPVFVVMESITTSSVQFE